MSRDAERGAGQLALALKLDAPALFETFVMQGNAELVARLRAAAEGLSPGLVWLAGDSGAGKTHLLQAACRVADERGRRAMYLALSSADAVPAWLQGLERIDCLALDELDAVAGDASWERALFGVLDAFLSGGTLLLAARNAPVGLGFELADLASRAAAATVYRVHALDDAGRLEALQIHARFRGLELDAATAQYLLSRVQRGMPELCAWLDRLDRVALREQRRLSIPLIREVLRSALAERA